MTTNPPSNVTGSYCSFRQKSTCLVRPVVDKISKVRIRRGKVEKFTYYLCEYHAKTVKR